MKKKVIVVGSGAGGATAAKELQGDFEVMIIEKGRDFHPFPYNLNFFSKFRHSGLLFDERLIQLLFPSMKVRKTKLKDSSTRMVVVNGIGLGGTTTLSAGNAMRNDEHLKNLGLNLDKEFEELNQEIPISLNHQARWSETSKHLFSICRKTGLNPEPLPKFGDYKKCSNCGRCVLGCKQGAKWDSRKFLHLAQEQGANLIMSRTVQRVVLENGKVKGVIAYSACVGNKGLKKEFYPADLVILAAGGLATPVILENSGLSHQDHLFIDPVLCVAGELPNAKQNREISMPFVVRKNGYIISPYFDYLSFFFNKKWRRRSENIYGIMIKLADENRGSILKNKIDKAITKRDQERLSEGVEICTNMLNYLGIKNKIFLGTLNAGHPGGMKPLTTKEVISLHHSDLPENLYISDASLFPEALGAPPILTIMALAKRISKVIKDKARAHY